MHDVETDVLVVGAGVTGLTASITLATRGVRAITIARHLATAPQPRASIVNQRTVEMLRGLGLEEGVRAVSTPLRMLNHNVVTTALANGTELARYKAYGTAERFSVHSAASPCESLNLPQHLHEPVLLAAARERGADVRFGNELISLEQSADAVDAVVRDRTTDREYRVRAKYVIGADGGRSRVAEQTGMTYEGQAGLRYMISYWVEADLRRYTEYRPATMYIITQPGEGFWMGAGTFLCVSPWDDWVLTREYDPSVDPDTSEEGIVSAVRTLVGVPDLPVRVKNVSKWQVNNVVAVDYRRGRVFLAGDAAHLHPPAGGLGGNTSMQDAFNISWKLASVLSGEAGEGLLDSYHDERRPIGRQVVDRAIKSMENMHLLVAALGFRRGQSVEEAEQAITDLFSDSPEAEKRRAEVDAAVRLQDYRSNAQGFELGQQYTSCAVVSDGTPFPEADLDPELYYHRTTHPGSHIPHAWVEKDRQAQSTLDVVGVGRYSLVTGVGGAPWAEAAQRLSAELGIELPVHFVGHGCEYADVLGDWTALREISDRGVLLVRPDRFIAWRSADLAAEPFETLQRAVRQALCRTDEAPVATEGAPSAPAEVATAPA